MINLHWPIIDIECKKSNKLWFDEALNNIIIYIQHFRVRFILFSLISKIYVNVHQGYL